MKKIFGITKINFMNSKTELFITFILLLYGGTSLILNYINHKEHAYSAGIGLYLILYLCLLSVFIPALKFKKIMILARSKNAYFWGAFINLVLVSGIVALVNNINYYYIETTIARRTGVINLIDLLGWGNHGFAALFLQQFVLYLFISSMIYTISFIQGCRFGWAVDMCIILCLAGILSSEVIKNELLDIIIRTLFSSNVYSQLFYTILFAVCTYFVTMPFLRSKSI